MFGQEVINNLLINKRIIIKFIIYIFSFSAADDFLPATMRLTTAAFCDPARFADTLFINSDLCSQLNIKFNYDTAEVFLLIIVINAVFKKD